MLTNSVLRLHAFAPSLREGAEVVTEPVPAPEADQVVVRQHFAGVNGVFDNVYSRGGIGYLTVTPPLDLGVEAVGVVEAVGQDVTSLRVGDAVACSFIGAGYRHWLVAGADRFMKIPAAEPRYVALRTSAVSALVGLEQAGRMTSGEVVVVTAAAGGMGQFVVQFAKRAGNTVVGVCSGPEKVALLERLGCDRAVDRRTEDVGEVIDREFGGEVSLVVDSVGGEVFDTLVARLGKLGRFVSAGHSADMGAEGATPVLAPRIYDQLYFKSASVIGFQNGLHVEYHRSAFERILEWDAAGELHVAIDPTPFVGLESVADAGDHLRSGRNVGKVVVDLRQDAT